MVLRNFLNFIIQLLLGIFNQLRNFYLNSNHYDKKLLKINYLNLVYKPSPHLLSSLIKYQKKKLILMTYQLKICGIKKI